MNPPVFRQPATDTGFTLVELVAVIVLIGVLAALVLPRPSGTGGFRERAAVDQVLSGIRHAQQQAMSRGAAVRFEFGGGRYAVEYRDPATGTFTPVSARSPWALPEGTTFSGTGQLTFDGKGALEKTPCPRTVNVGGGTITVECETGFAHAG